MDHAGIAAAHGGADRALLLEHDDAAAGERQRARGGETHHAGTHHDDVRVHD
jgi:hypothetical protein